MAAAAMMVLGHAPEGIVLFDYDDHTVVVTAPEGIVLSGYDDHTVVVTAERLVRGFVRFERFSGGEWVPLYRQTWEEPVTMRVWEEPITLRPGVRTMLLVPLASGCRDIRISIRSQ